MIFETRFVNKRDSAVRVFEYGRELIRLQPGEARHVESRSPKTSWARWSVVKFSGDDKVSFDENKDWRWPWPDKLMLEFVNIDGTASEGLMIAGQVYQSDKNIPKLIPISPRDTSWCFIQKIERRLVEHRVREGDFIIKKKVLEDVKFMRSRKECRDLQKQLEDAAVEKARREVQARFPKSADTMANTE